MSMRSYDDSCGVARALDVVGDRWALLVVRELLHGPKRFADLRRGLPGLSQNVLAQRLRDLEDAAVIGRHRLGPPAGSAVYQLTPWGEALQPVVHALGRWGSGAPHRSTNPLSVDALVGALEVSIDPKASTGCALEIGVEFEDDAFALTVRDGVLTAVRRHTTAPTLTTSVEGLTSLVFGDVDLTTALDNRTATVTGDTTTIREFLALFPKASP